MSEELTADYWLIKSLPPSPTPLTTETPGTIGYLQIFPKIELNQLLTATHLPAASCPQSQGIPESTPVFSTYGITTDDIPNPATAEEVLSFLNTYGPIPLVGKNAVPSDNLLAMDSGAVTAFQDFTNDKIPEIVITQHGWMRIYSCRDGLYQVIFELGPDGHSLPPKIEAIHDLNRNGIPEIYLQIASATQAARELSGMEWDGEKFQRILLYPDGQDYVWVEPGYFTFQDMDHDGLQEVVAIWEIPVWSDYVQGLPWRIAKEVFKWNGKVFLFYQEILDPPVFRFQAVEDGDRASLVGDYEKALDLYQQAIFSDKLEWYSQARRETMQQQWQSRYAETPLPSPTIPAPDPMEFDNLAAYAGYRILLIHVKHGYLSDAQVVYDDLQKKYSGSKNGSYYAEMAAEFWSEYSATRDMTKGCAKALEFARLHWPGVTYYLGNTKGGYIDFGDQGLDYEKDGNMLCPF
jgi:hypothetical protein